MKHPKMHTKNTEQKEAKKEGSEIMIRASPGA